MRAIVLEKPVKSNELKVSNVPIPKVMPGWVLIKVKAFGINRSEIFTRNGLSPSVLLPRIIGIECVGEIVDSSDSSMATGQKVISMMGGLGRDFDGGYAEYVLIPTQQVYPVQTDLNWEELAAIPEMYYTSWCSLTDTLKIKQGETILIRGGTSSVGIASIQLAKALKTTVVATTRNPDKSDLLRRHGADCILIDDGTIKEQMQIEFPDGADKILELLGTKTLKSSFGLLKQGGILCVSGILGGEWELEKFAPMDFIPSGSYLTIYDSKIVNMEKLADMLDFVKVNQLKPPIAKVFILEEIAQAHELMESNKACGKIVVVV